MPLSKTRICPLCESERLTTLDIAPAPPTSLQAPRKVLTFQCAQCGAVFTMYAMEEKNTSETLSEPPRKS
jgi:transcription elongation factor Elf1